jgi:hypothetical protein
MNKIRRRFVGAFATGAVAIPLSGLLALRQAQAAGTPKLSPDDPAAKSLMYSHKSADANKLCSGCQFYTGAADAEWGACMIFPKKLVSAVGVCNSWFKRAG